MALFPHVRFAEGSDASHAVGSGHSRRGRSEYAQDRHTEAKTAMRDDEHQNDRPQIAEDSPASFCPGILEGLVESPQLVGRRRIFFGAQLRDTSRGVRPAQHC